MSVIDDFCALMREYTDFLEQTAVQEKDKLDALLSEDLQLIEHTIAAGQALEKKIDVFEKSRMQLLQAMGMPDATFAQVLTTLDEKTQTEMTKVFHRMQAATDTVKYYNEKSLSFVKNNLKRMHLMEQSAGSEAGYSPDKKHPDGWDDTNLFTTKI